MPSFLTLYIITFLAFLVVDLLWLGLVARNFYRKYLGFIMAPSPNWTAAIAFYLIFVGGIVYFVLLPGLESASLAVTLQRAALYGLITYATYDLTNLATLKDWPLLVTLVDLAWGVALSTSVSAIAFGVSRWLG